MSGLLTDLKHRARDATRRWPALAPVVARIRGVEPRTLRVGGRDIHFVCGPNEYARGTGVDKAGRYEGPFVDRLVASLTANPNAIYFDVGGGQGVDALIAATFGVRQIHSWEPDGVCAWFVARNLRGQRYNLHREFVGDHDDASTITLDAFCRKEGLVPTHVKLDIEGHEVHALAGMRELLSRRERPTLFVEFHERIIRDELRLPERVAPFFETLRAAGYTLEFNAHHYGLATGTTGYYDDAWLSEPPNHVNFALIATPPVA